MFNYQSVLVFLDISFVIVSILLGVPITVLFIECLSALFPGKSETGKKEVQINRQKIAVLVPAHNESSGIGATIETLKPQLTERDRIIVIADNCTDETATIARELGATAIERKDTSLRGKGYALDYGLKFIAQKPPEVVVIVDADCIVEEGAIAKLAQLAGKSGKPVQANYLMEKPPQPKPKDLVSALAVTVKNVVRPSGLTKLGLPCVLGGTGMAFPWSAIGEVSLASGNLVEDMQLTVDLAIAGHPTLFCHDAKVTGRLPQQQEAAKQQRTRWEHGHLKTSFTQVPRLLKASFAQRRFDLLALALDFCVLPLSLLVMIWIAATAMAFVAGWWGITSIALVLLLMEGFLLLSSIVASWVKFGRADLPLLTLLSVPFYILWKIPLYLGFLIKPQTQWIRTQRDITETQDS
ncbi:MAG TPA: glycosyl transferase [Cyanobacteria bacterium UBA11149]|nr:glycosyl transferase [Cyanobacteria bacterium UBA11367]HBE57029.1 glycosyl transferase [Cyanobacteria bacterium UBA11366]HBR73041.1 glycosyl transferase [Cyanobacteria bacterium UBA11159]HBS72744.1 glycosyl transferase [Cyanobacteria bacterium UBA11153]HBW88866.1 glycosyl transferase [Cyanobacteria bacterium UBA11149]HCA97029.1 glycosyl transferase [Cyanobacteria bacterium UBA9226]